MTQNKFLQVGDVIEIQKGMSINTQLEERFVYSNRRKSHDLTTNTITVGQVLNDTHGNSLDTKKFSGKYVVVKARMDGGGGAPHDPYPDGWHITARKLKRDGTYSAKGTEINFYQSGCFNCEILPQNISPVAKMKHILIEDFVAA